jgi:hypothetical protein
MLLFPSDVEALLVKLAEQLDLDPGLAEACRPSFEHEAYDELISTASSVLQKRLRRKAGVVNDQALTSDWHTQIEWEGTGFTPGQAKALASFCWSVLSDSQALPCTRKTGRAILLLTDALLGELDRLPDLTQPTEDSAEFDARPFFGEMVKSLTALLPYERRDFPTEMTQTQVKLLLSDLPDGAYYGVKIFAPGGSEPGRLEMGLYFEAGDIEKLTHHFRRKVPGLSHSLGGKEIKLEEGGDWLSISLHQPYQPAEKLSAFMTAATLVGFIGSIQERMPRR